jgi:hypothetical protein
MIDLRERSDKIPDVSADAEVRNSAGIEDDPVRHGKWIRGSYTEARASFQL